MSRPTTPLLARLANLLSVSEPELQSNMDAWPVVEPHKHTCMAGPRNLIIAGKTRTLISALFELILEEPLHPSWRPFRLCGIETCRNLLHYELRTVHHCDGTISEDLPIRCFRAGSDAAMADAVEDDPEDVIDTVLTVEG